MRVAVAIITNTENKILITRRAKHLPFGGLWEFPGGKIIPNESPETALCREIKEEVDLEIISFHYLHQINYINDKKDISLLIYHVDNFLGEAKCCEQQIDLKWVASPELSQYDFPAANREIIRLWQDRTH